jgi:hypothetical protein
VHTDENVGQVTSALENAGAEDVHLTAAAKEARAG